MSLFKRKSSSQTGSMRNFYGNMGDDEITKKSRRYFGDDGDSIHHSRYYHRYYEGYTEVRTKNSGNEFKPYKIQRIYTAPYTIVDMDARLYMAYRLLYGMLMSAAIVLFFSAMADSRVPVNTSKLAGLIVMFTSVPLVVLAASLVGYYLRPRKMKLYDFRSSTRLLKGSALASSIGFCVAVLIFAVYLLIFGIADLKAELFFALQLLLASAASLALFLLERKMQYKQIDNDVKLPKGEYHRIQ